MRQFSVSRAGKGRKDEQDRINNEQKKRVERRAEMYIKEICIRLNVNLPNRNILPSFLRETIEKNIDEVVVKNEILNNINMYSQMLERFVNSKRSSQNRTIVEDTSNNQEFKYCYIPKPDEIGIFREDTSKWFQNSFMVNKETFLRYIFMLNFRVRNLIKEVEEEKPVGVNDFKKFFMKCCLYDGMGEEDDVKELFVVFLMYLNFLQGRKEKVLSVERVRWMQISVFGREYDVEESLKDFNVPSDSMFIQEYCNFLDQYKSSEAESGDQ